MDQPKLERLLRLMKMLTANSRFTVEEIADRLGMSVRTIYRYIDTFREAGFVIKKNGSCVRIDKSSPYFKDISQLVHFTEEEAYILKSAIESIDETNLLKQTLKKKLYAVYDFKILADTVTRGRNAANVHQLIEAIGEKKQVILHEYSSAHSHAIRNRLVEAFAFTTNYIQMWCYDVESSENKLFKTSRIGSVEITQTPWQHEPEHHQGHIDLFRISSYEQHRVCLRMGLRAASLLTEEYPLAEKQLVKLDDNLWFLDTLVCSYDGIGRFVIGLMDDIEIVDSPEFRNFMDTRLHLLLSASRTPCPGSGSRIAALISDHPALLLMLQHLGVSLPLEAQTLGELSATLGISESLMLAITRLYTRQEAPYTPESFKDLMPIVSFLKNTHRYYLQEAYPAIAQEIQTIAPQDDTEILKLADRFFNEYFAEVQEHLRYEDEVVFPYVDRLYRGIPPEDGNGYSVAEYREHHDDIEEKLEDLRNLLLKYLPCHSTPAARRALLMKLSELESDLRIHSRIEEMLLIPLVERLEHTTDSRE